MFKHEWRITELATRIYMSYLAKQSRLLFGEHIMNRNKYARTAMFRADSRAAGRTVGQTASGRTDRLQRGTQLLTERSHGRADVERKNAANTQTLRQQRGTQLLTESRSMPVDKKVLAKLEGEC